MDAKTRIKRNVNKIVLYGVYQFDTDTLLCDSLGTPVLHRKKKDIMEDWKSLSDGECEQIIKVKLTVIT